MENFSIDTSKPLEIEGKKYKIKDVRFNIDQDEFALTCEYIKEKPIGEFTVIDFINQYKELKFNSDFQELEIKRLKCVINEYEHILKMYQNNK
jgi:hypothetical protein